jgi:hypothetical protein
MFPASIGGLRQPLAGLVAGDRGCLPTVGATFIPQATNLQLTLTYNASNVSAPAIAADFSSLTLLLCSTSGACCRRDFCNKNYNTMSRVEMSSFAVFMSISLTLLRV